MAYTILRRRWTTGKAPHILLMVAELLGTIGCLVLFALAQPDLYRSEFWRIGYEQGWNSDPRMILYAYANHRPLPTIPFVWSQTLTDFNVAISVISLFVLLTKCIMYIMAIFYPVLGLGYGIVMTALYVVSVYGQIGPDHADPKQQTNVAWYIQRSCSVARRYGMEDSCKLAKASLAVTVLMLVFYLVNVGFSLWAMWPNPRYDIERDPNEDDDDDSYRGNFRPSDNHSTSSRSSTRSQSYPTDKEPAAFRATEAYEMSKPGAPQAYAMPLRSPGPAPGSPFTPRTQAFHSLDRKLPLRS